VHYLHVFCAPQPRNVERKELKRLLGSFEQPWQGQGGVGDLFPEMESGKERILNYEYKSPLFLETQQ
jgi:hypothetical protein